MHSPRSSCLCVTAIIIVAATSCFAQTAEPQEKALLDAENPIATRISVPFQSNTYFHTGPLEKVSHVLIIQPVIPIKLTARWNLITRLVTRVVYLPRTSSDQGSQFGLGNLKPEFYVSPVTSGKVIWGVGPKLHLPTATHHELGTNRLGGGPTAAIVATNGPWIIGIIANNVWAGSGKERIRQMTLSPFINFKLTKGWYFVSSPVITSNWAATSSDRWTVPLGGGLGRLFKIARQPVNARIQGLYNASRPAFAPLWQLQVQVQLLFSRQ